MSFIKRMLRGYLTFLCLLGFVSLLIFIFTYIKWEYIAVFTVISLFAYDVGGNETEGPFSKQVTKCITFFIKIFSKKER